MVTCLGSVHTPTTWARSCEIHGIHVWKQILELKISSAFSCRICQLPVDDLPRSLWIDFRWFEHGLSDSSLPSTAGYPNPFGKHCCTYHCVVVVDWASRLRSLDADRSSLFDAGWKARMGVMGRRFTALWMLQSATGESRQLETPELWHVQNGRRFVNGTHLLLWSSMIRCSPRHPILEKQPSPDVLGAILGHIK